MTVLVPAHLDVTASGRGLAAMPAISDGLGTDIEVYESAAASGPHICLKATGTSGTSGWTVRAHLPAAEAWRLAEQLITAVRNHYQGDATPDSAAYAVTPLWRGLEVPGHD